MQSKWRGWTAGLQATLTRPQHWGRWTGICLISHRALWFIKNVHKSYLTLQQPCKTVMAMPHLNEEIYNAYIMKKSIFQRVNHLPKFTKRGNKGQRAQVWWFQGPCSLQHILLAMATLPPGRRPRLPTKPLLPKL